MWPRPAYAMIGLLDRHAHIRGGTLLGAGCARFVVGEAHIGDLRVELEQALAQAQMQRVNGPCPVAVAECTPSCARRVTVAVLTALCGALWPGLRYFSTPVW